MMRGLVVCCGLLAVLSARSSLAQVPWRSLTAALNQRAAESRVATRGATAPVSVAPNASVGSGGLFMRHSSARPAFGSLRGSVLARVTTATEARSHGWQPVADGWAAKAWSFDEALPSMPEHWLATWAPPRHWQMERLAEWIRLDVVRDPTGRSGQGVVVGIVDSGIDFRHADLRTVDGEPRVLWWLDFSLLPQGLHPDLEEEYGCHSDDAPCAVFDSNDLSVLLKSAARRPRPGDSIGHGTHVASLAAGNGAATDSRYAGVAPEASLVVVKVARKNGDILDGDILNATRFVFERAMKTSMPAVVNLSLGSSFGPHDGSGALEEALASFVGPDHPGRAIVVAAGNRGTLLSGASAGATPFWGHHTEVHVPCGSQSTVQVLSPHTGVATTQGSILVWVSSRPGDELSFRLQSDERTLIPEVAPGDWGLVEEGQLQAMIVNSTAEASPNVRWVTSGVEGALARGNGAMLLITGSWASGALFDFVVEGHGSAQFWIQSEGDLGPGSNATGAQLARALSGGSVSIPAVHPELIAVGATVNRDRWRNYQGDRYLRAELLWPVFPSAGERASFSASGPSELGGIKPDLMAPGALVVGAMGEEADPRPGWLTIFSGFGLCPKPNGPPTPECLVIDEAHAISSGTSMSAPVVSGAVALLFQDSPWLTQDLILGLLQAGASRPTPGADEHLWGAGLLDIAGMLEAEAALIAARAEPRARASSVSVLRGASEPRRAPSSGTSWLHFSSAFVRPDPTWPFSGMLHLKDKEGRLVVGLDPERLQWHIEQGELVVAPREVAPGLWRFMAAADSGTGGERLTLRVEADGEPFVALTVPIAVDAHVATSMPMARGGCSFALPLSRVQWPFVLLLVLGFGGCLALRRRTLVFLSYPTARCR